MDARFQTFHMLLFLFMEKLQLTVPVQHMFFRRDSPAYASDQIAKTVLLVTNDFPLFIPTFSFTA